MAEPQELKLVSEKEILKLEQTKKALLTDIASLRTKQQYLSVKVSGLQATFDQHIAEHDDEIEELTDTIDVLKGERDKLQDTLQSLNLRIAGTTSDLEVMKQATDDQVAELDAQLQGKRAEIASLDTEKATIEDDIDALKGDLQVQTNKIVDVQVDMHRAVADGEERQRQLELDRQHIEADISDSEKQLECLKHEYSQMLKNIIASQKELADATKKHEEYKTYEERAQKALQSHELALMERERQLEVRIVTSRRRDGVLDNL